MLKTYRDNTNWDLTWPEWCLNCDVVRDASNSRLQLTKNIGEMVKLQGDIAWMRLVGFRGQKQYRLLLKNVLVLINEGTVDEKLVCYAHLNVFVAAEAGELTPVTGTTVHMTGEVGKYRRSMRAVSHGSQPYACGINQVTIADQRELVGSLA